MSYRLYHHLLLKLMLLAVAVDHVPAVKLPVFTFSEANRPAEIGVVKAQATCGSIVEHDLSCGTAVSWKQWTTVDASGKLQTVDKTLTVGCNHDQTISGNKASATGTSCQTAVSCSDGTCSDLASDTSKSIYAFWDPHCFINAQDGDKLHSRWGNFEKSIREIGEKNPEGAEATKGDIYVVMPTLEEAHGKGIIGHMKRFLGHGWWGTGLMAGDKIEASFSCKDGCRYGRHIQVNYGGAEKGMHVFLQPKCDWFTVCTDWKDGICGYQNTINVMLRNGFVSFDSRHEQLPTRLIRQTKDGQGVVRVDLSLFSGGKVGGSFAQAAVTTMFRQRVMGAINMEKNYKMMMTFSHPDCLHPDFGLRAQTSDVQVVLLKTETEQYKNDVKDKNKANVDVTDCQQTIVAGPTLPPVTPAPPVSITPADVTAVATTTLPPPTPGQAIHAGPNAANPYATMADWEGHATWAIFYGWLIGSFLAMAVMAPIMYFCRRSLYNNWYRGMYVRYGCDASGTTGGMTGSAFGDTTTSGSTMMTLQSQMDSATITETKTTGASSMGSSIASSVEPSKTPTETQGSTIVTM